MLVVKGWKQQQQRSLNSIWNCRNYSRSFTRGKDGNSRVIEVADTFIGKQTTQEQTQKVLRYGGRVTVEEVLDGIFQQTKASNIPADPSLPQSDRPPSENLDGPGIYTSNYMLMDKVIQQPHLAEDLLNQEQLFVRCGRCHKTKGIREARGYFVSCKHCYTYYCSRQCRSWDWQKHRERCSFARINTLCKEVIMKVRQDAETQYHMSRVARDGYKNYGRGSVNIRLHSAHAAQQYLLKGWKAFETMDHSKLLFYYPVQALIDQGKEQSLITLCRKYNPSDKFILSVSIIADIEYCPETPPPEPYQQQQQQHYQQQQQQHHKSPYTQTADMYSALVPTDV
uniref:MYND-type domain-containing protein n=1 Tax=Panagrolaimus superbus TaxID=310955 RepID=A0A914Z6X0_9BILA